MTSPHLVGNKFSMGIVASYVTAGMWLYILLVDVSLVDPVLHVSHGAHVERGVGQGAVDHGQTKVRQHSVDQAHYHQVPVVR